MSRQRPLLMKPRLVRKTRHFQKTETRRVTGLDQVNEDPANWKFTGFEGPDKLGRLVAIFEDVYGLPFYVKVPCPYGSVGDILWVRENWQYWNDEFHYQADQEDLTDLFRCPLRFNPSIHMPREAARIFLKLTGLRVERIQDITEDGAQAEGADQGLLRPYCLNSWQLELGPGGTYLDGFRYIWFTIHDPRDWHRNVWVWVLKYQKQ